MFCNLHQLLPHWNSNDFMVETWVRYCWLKRSVEKIKQTGQVVSGWDCDVRTACSVQLLFKSWCSTSNSFPWSTGAPWLRWRRSAGSTWWRWRRWRQRWNRSLKWRLGRRSRSWRIQRLRFVADFFWSSTHAAKTKTSKGCRGKIVYLQVGSCDLFWFWCLKKIIWRHGLKKSVCINQMNSKNMQWLMYIITWSFPHPSF